eukprot:4159990-Pyramimonas_sp.AAC.1
MSNFRSAVRVEWDQTRARKSNSDLAQPMRLLSSETIDPSAANALPKYTMNSSSVIRTPSRHDTRP